MDSGYFALWFVLGGLVAAGVAWCAIATNSKDDRP